MPAESYRTVHALAAKVAELTYFMLILFAQALLQPGAHLQIAPRGNPWLSLVSVGNAQRPVAPIAD